MAKFSLEKQTYEVPGSRTPGQTGKVTHHHHTLVEIKAISTFVMFNRLDLVISFFSTSNKWYNQSMLTIVENRYLP